jgi:hypothetical protein
MAELNNERRKEGADILLSVVPKIEEEVRNVSRFCVGDVFNILDDR